MNIRGERILILGDSLSALPPYTTTKATVVDLTSGTTASSPGSLLGKQLLAVGAQAVRVNARVSRSAISFIQSENGLTQIASDISAFHPTKVVVFLGTNDIDRGTTPDALARTVNAMHAIRDAFQLTGAEVVALGPPSYANARYAQAAPTMLATIRKAFGPDRTLDIQLLTPTTARTGDGVHFTAPAAQTAALNIAQALAQAFVPVPVVAPGMSDGAKLALGALGIASVVGLSWLVLRTAKRSELGAVDVKLIKRVAQLISYDVPKEDIHDQLIADGYTEDDVFQAHQAAKVYLRRRELPDSNFGHAFRFGMTMARHFARRRVTA